MASEPRTTGLTYDDLLRMFPDEDLTRREDVLTSPLLPGFSLEVDRLFG
jgi:hypothetical protein